MRIAVILSQALLAMALLMSGNVLAQAPNSAGLKVTILFYSGRPDPTYVLKSADNLKYVKARMQNLKQIPFDQKTIIPSTVGYRGIVVENTGKVAGLPERFAVSQGKIEVMGRQRSVHSDQNRNLEKFLLQQAVTNKAIDERLAKKFIAGTVESPKTAGHDKRD